LYGFGLGRVVFAELLRILEKSGATGLGDSPGARRSVGIGLAKSRDVLSGGGRSFLFGIQGLVSIEQAFEDGDSGAEVVAEGEEQVNVVEVFLAAEAVGEVVARIDGGAHVAAVWAKKAEVAFADFGGRPVTTEGGDRDGHRQVVAKATHQVG